MSVEASAWAFAQQGLSSGSKLLLVAIANRGDKAGVCFPGRESLAGDCCCRPETVTANMKALEAEVLIARFERRRRNGSRTSDWLVLAPEAPNRQPMVDADPDEVPGFIARVARETSPEDSQGEVSSREVSRVGQVRNSGGPPEPSEERTDEGSSEPSSQGDDDLSSSPPPNPREAEFEEWLEHHERTTGTPPPRRGTQARRARFREFSARRSESYSLEDLKLATVGAYNDELRRRNGHYGHQSVLRPTKIDDLIAKGRRQVAKTAGSDERRLRAEQERWLKEAQE